MTRSALLTTLYSFACSLATSAVVGADDSARALELFESKVRPALIQHCYECHSTAATELKGGLAVDFAAGLTKGGDSGPALVAGKPDESLVVAALKYDGVEMPPSGRLPDDVIAAFEEWIRLGAADPRTEVSASVPLPERPPIDIAAGREFWAFRPLVSQPTPAVNNVEWSQTWIDRFILAQLEQEQLAPQPDTDRFRLLRRLSFDLTGLPPSEESLREFLSDESPQALVRVVDRLLESSQYGEHWGRHWLDLARYADSNGGDFNATFHDAWRYRDYVIDAFNHDKPYHEFIREQLAGDLLPAANDDERVQQVVATGFLMLGAKMLSERDKVKLQMDLVDEQVDSVGKAVLGLSLGCARCHDHKFDPIPTADYYALAGIFKSSEVLEGEIQKYVSNWIRYPLPIEPEHAAALAAHAKLKSEMTERIKQSKAAKKKADEALKKATSGAAPTGPDVVVDDVDATKVGQWKASTHSPNFVGVGYVHNDKQGIGEKSITYTPNLPTKGRYEVRVSYTHSGGRETAVPITVRHADGVAEVKLNQEKEPSIDGVYEPIGGFVFEAGMTGSVEIGTAATTGHVIADAVAFVSLEPPAKQTGVDSAPAELGASEALDPSHPDAQAALLKAAVDEAEAAVKAAAEEVKRLEKELKELDKSAPPKAPAAFAIREAKQPTDCAVCIRGEHKKLGPVVPRGFLQVAMYEGAPTVNAQSSGRLELANWIADARHPLTARVYVNRVWQHLLGEGLVRSVDNFGTLGDRPTHPELLDRLASEFIRHDWSTKWLVREIVTSRVYQLETSHDDATALQDPENKLLWRGHRKRLPAEGIRDSLLTAAGQLDRTRGPSPVAKLGTLVNENDVDSEAFTPTESQYRSLYLPLIRGSIPTVLTVFDFADPDFVVGRREATTVPAQALFLLNSPLVAASATATADRVLKEASPDANHRVDWVYLNVLSRFPSDAERTRAVAMTTRVSDSPATAEGLTTERDNWTHFIQALFASTEFRLLD